MSECFKCGVSEEKAKLHDAISSRGIVKICENCNSFEKLPLIRKATENQIAGSQTQQSVRERLTGMSRGKLLAGREVSLRELVDRNLKERQAKLPPDLADNFHWTIQRIRRARKITREEFARGISEPEATVRMIEQGILPNNDYKIINKIESYLKVSLRKPGTSGFPTAETKRFSLDNSILSNEERKEKKLSFDEQSARDLKIADLREMKKKQEEKNKTSIDSWEDETSQDDEQFLDEQEELDEEENI